jgi:tripartite-type tricarboxylate transporter receptor subunit TctC
MALIRCLLAIAAWACVSAHAQTFPSRPVHIVLKSMRAWSISTPAEFAALIKSAIVKWAKVVKESGAKLD